MYFQSRWILPIDRPPMHGGWIEVIDGRIGRLGTGRPPDVAEDLGDVAILPGLVNAHTHLELSWLQGRVRPASSMVQWIRALLAERARTPPGGHAPRLAAIRQAIAAARDSGTVLVGDVCNSLETIELVREAGLDAVIFYELVGFNVADPATTVREAWDRLDAAVGQARPPVGVLLPTVVAHAPYSVSPAMFGEIAHRQRDVPLTVHLAESVEETEFLRTGRGVFRDLLEEIGAWNPAWEAPGCDPVEYLQQVGYLRRGLLVVHGVHLMLAALDRLRDAGAIVVTCPRSNEWVGGGLPPVSRFYAAGVPVAVGTDSLASTASLNLFDELAELRRIAPDVSAASFLESATRVGAHALGFGHIYGTLRAGKRAALVSVDVPPGVRDVEEYLVSGVPPSVVRRLPS